MANSGHHGMQSEGKLNPFYTCESFKGENIGMFGRMFGELAPQYTNAQSLIDLGSVGGPMNGGDNELRTTSVPLGIVFLGQFIDHDITLDTTSSLNSINNPREIENVRTANLDLDCIFGGGPEDEPFLYTRPFDSDELYLITGRANKNSNQGADFEKEDLARTGPGVAIIGDPRNDENRVLSQLQLAFIRFYNHVYKLIRDNNESYSAREVYEEARRITTWHYQWIVVNEFLPAMCGESVVNDILGHGRQFYTPQGGAFIPVEFSVAAYRFGHSMIAETMQLHPQGPIARVFSSSFGHGFSRLNDLQQVVDWSLFFGEGSEVQHAAKFNTKLAPSLLNLPEQVVGKGAPPEDRSLATRNLRRGQSFGLPAGETVARLMGREEAEVLNVLKFIEVLLDGTNIDLSSGIPLWYYILAEGEQLGKNGNMPGEGLGPVGARIVAEVIIGLLELDTNSYLGSNRGWIPTLGENSNFTMLELADLANQAKTLA